MSEGVPGRTEREKMLAGVTIGENTAIGAGGVVTRDMPTNFLADGNPCRVIRELG